MVCCRWDDNHDMKGLIGLVLDGFIRLKLSKQATGSSQQGLVRKACLFFCNVNEVNICYLGCALLLIMWLDFWLRLDPGSCQA